MSPEVGIIRTYLDWLLELPWGVLSEDNLDVSHAAEVLDARHYGLPKAKERILEYIAVRKLAAEKMRSPILCFVGPPGTGKTSLGKSIAEALGRKFVRVSLGGIRDEAEIRGHRRTYIGALPGRIIQTMRRAETVNPLFMLDEIDKVGNDFQGDPSSALLEVLDPEQNFAFSDHYLEVPYDLSKVLFVTTANWMDPIPPALRDRMEVIEFPGYIEEEKLAIARSFLIPRQFEEHGLTATPLDVQRAGDPLDHPRIHLRGGRPQPGARDRQHLPQDGAPRGRRQADPAQRDAGGGDALSGAAQVRLRRGRREGPDRRGDGRGVDGGRRRLAAGRSHADGGQGRAAAHRATGRGDARVGAGGAQLHAQPRPGVGAESAASLKRPTFTSTCRKGRVPKDGPSAGVTIATALVSAFTRRPVRRDVAMTGEITLRGRVLPIGGLKEKVLAAHRAGLKTMILPKKNKKDMVEIPKRVQRDLTFVLVEQVDEVLEAALLPPVESPRPKRKPAKKKGRTTRTESMA